LPLWPLPLSGAFGPPFGPPAPGFQPDFLGETIIFWCFVVFLSGSLHFFHMGIYNFYPLSMGI
jgi:hypothetical protein